MGLNIFRLIGDFFEMLFIPFEKLRLGTALGEDGWWYSNVVNWVFVAILVLLLSYWISQAIKFKRQGKEDNA